MNNAAQVRGGNPLSHSNLQCRVDPYIVFGVKQNNQCKQSFKSERKKWKKVMLVKRAQASSKRKHWTVRKRPNGEKCIEEDPEPSELWLNIAWDTTGRRESFPGS
uniref:Uncharacterized protein n=1 Tax=Romanomermis culicivorax TaxID=13658 RepID=A0A915LC19_ROMCU